jgi:hypothetical protein
MVEITSFPTMIVAARAIVVGAFAIVMKATNQYTGLRQTMTLTGVLVQRPIYTIVLQPLFLALRRSNLNCDGVTKIATVLVTIDSLFDVSGTFTDQCG